MIVYNSEPLTDSINKIESEPGNNDNGGYSTKLALVGCIPIPAVAVQLNLKS